ncbi:hypothetical protein A2865_03620 [Candidatus Woesebacteria bacterium RIFCSPHIGHO2_01_FULL_39_17]|uniref:L-lactate dehydrogenase n=3 Tax=Candidatus Woeseibacteriota TaxID=1752722 RepID=A0A0G0NFP7_9BACT|nr:MAG: malate dehydrogenase, malate dehydrogenase [Microgenomates group bacterium GW2011_GWC1_38_12]KKQ93760.1 MAG: L-lactate dehydrogenase [Candidatus Woesebacteria bacterium GW2011_GWB1_39_10b]KKR14323.1 MAG: L-lactate dehydrogenase [Candidatus Woesebacteria bacterium GW2011_GWA1_39_21b]OGM23620.1 MAG: hypothetical protein A2865_03620 [Candidatus Woesebacteria bacterium RIFCSPHIGHO2_01_FULL_39_17]OGM64356.1 MAG: hypothetical protein A3A52_05475 [Candidatus Woesebacteria bacterium RIFCSPLOWO2
MKVNQENIKDNEVIFSVPGTNLRFKLINTPKFLSVKPKKKIRLNIAEKLPKDYLAFHAALLKKNNKGILITGKSGSGKTTLAFELQKQGYQILANDFVVLWLEGEIIYAGDLNLYKNNIGKKKMKVDKVICLEPQDKRDIFSFDWQEWCKFYYKTLQPINKKGLKTNNSMVFKKAYEIHVVLGNRQNILRWLTAYSRLCSTNNISSLGILGFGTIGSSLVASVLEKTWLKGLSIYSTKLKELKGVKMDIESARPNISIKIANTSKDLFSYSDIVVISFNVNNPQNIITKYGERMRKLYSHLEVIWNLSRDLRLINFKGIIFIVTNPVDILSTAIYYFTNLDEEGKYDWRGLLSNQVFGVGLGLDYKRLKTLTQKNYEVVGEHGENLILAVVKGNKLHELKNDKLLKKVVNFSPSIRKYTKRTIYGPVKEISDLLDAFINNNRCVRLSSLQKEGYFLGNIYNLSNGVLNQKYFFNKKLRFKYKKILKSYSTTWNNLIKKHSNITSS